MLNSLADDLLSSILPSETQIKERKKKTVNEVDLVVEYENDVKKVKILNIYGIKKKKIFKFCENNSILLDYCVFYAYPLQIQMIKNNVIVLERNYYSRDLVRMIESKSLSSEEICLICDKLMILLEYGLIIYNLKSCNIVYDDDGEIKLCDLFLNLLRKVEDLRIYDICFKSPEELNGLECNDGSVIWSIGCILYEIVCKKLPFNEDNNINKTKDNIMRCKYSFDLKCNEMMKEMIERMLKVKREERMNLKELKKEIMKTNEILKDKDNNLMIYNERKEILFNSDYTIEISTFYIQSEYYLDYPNYESIRDDLIEFYNNKPSEKVLLLLLMMKIYKKDNWIQNKLKFHRYYHYKDYGERKIFNISTNQADKEKINVISDCICLYEEGIDYFFRIMRLINPKKLRFSIDIPKQHQSLFGSYFNELKNLKELYLSSCRVTFHFIESFVKSIQYIKLNYIDLEDNPIGSKGFKLLLPYLHILINKKNELHLYGMNLDDKSMILLSEELHKYPNLKRINIRENKKIHSKGLKALFSKFPISKIEFDLNRSKELLIEKCIPKIINSIKNSSNVLNLNNYEIDDDFFKSFISLRLNELGEIEQFDLRNNKLTYKSVEILINNLCSFTNLRKLQLYGNEIGDEGMKILSSHRRLLKDEYDYYNKIDCSKMGFSSIGLKYLLDGFRNYHNNIHFDISCNNIDSKGVGYLMDYVKENNIKYFVYFDIYNNPIGNDGFRLLLNYLYYLIDEDGEIIMSNIAIDDESIILLGDTFLSNIYCNTINLKENGIRMNGLKLICSKSLENDNYPFIELKCSSWNDEELKYYLDYCTKKDREKYDKIYDLSNMNINDSHIFLIKQIYYYRLDLSNNKITSTGLKELIDSLPEEAYYISIYNNEIGDEGIEIICKNINKFVNFKSLNLLNIEMREKGLKMLIEAFKDCTFFDELNLSGNELNERELRLMEENKEVFVLLEELSITVKKYIDKTELKLFLETFSSIGIKLDGISEEEKKELSKEFVNIK